MVAHLIVTALLAFQAGNSSKLGHTDKQIAAMGEAKWVNYYTDKVGGSTADMCDAEVVYGGAIFRLNQAALKKKPEATRAAVEKLRKHMASYRMALIDVGRSLTGGGTMWNPIYASDQADIEESIAIISGVRTAKPKPRRVSNVTTALKDITDLTEKSASDIESYKQSGASMTDVRDSLTTARKEFRTIADILAKRPRRESDAILGFCIDCVSTAGNG
jgi:hypothetical protein